MEGGDSRLVHGATEPGRGEWWEWVEVARINPDRQGKEGVKKYVQISPPPLTHSHRDLESGALFDGQNQQLLQDVGQENGQGSM